MKHLLLLTLILITACHSTPNQTAETTPAQPTKATEPHSDVIEIDFAALRTFTPSNGGPFTISYPTFWKVFEQPDGVIIIDPSNQAGYSAFFSQTDTAPSRDDLNAVAEQFIHDNFGQNSQFEITDQSDSTIQFRSMDPDIGSAMNELTVIHDGDYIFYALISIAEPQWLSQYPSLKILVESLSPQPAIAPVVPLDTSAPPTWLVFGHPTERYAFLYPSNWTVTENGKAASAIWPDLAFSFDVDVVSVADVAQDPTRAEAYLTDRVASLTTQTNAFEARPIEPYQSGTAIGYTVDYLYTNEAGLAMAGSIIVTTIEGALYQITIESPALSYEAALTWFNPMLQSFQFLPQE